MKFGLLCVGLSLLAAITAVGGSLTSTPVSAAVDNAISQDGDPVRIVITADKQSATIESGVEIPYQEATSSGATCGDGSRSSRTRPS